MSALVDAVEFHAGQTLVARIKYEGDGLRLHVDHAAQRGLVDRMIVAAATGQPVKVITVLDGLEWKQEGKSVRVTFVITRTLLTNNADPIYFDGSFSRSGVGRVSASQPLVVRRPDGRRFGGDLDSDRPSPMQLDQDLPARAALQHLLGSEQDRALLRAEFRAEPHLGWSSDQHVLRFGVRVERGSFSVPTLRAKLLDRWFARGQSSGVSVATWGNHKDWWMWQSAHAMSTPSGRIWHARFDGLPVEVVLSLWNDLVVAPVHEAIEAIRGDARLAFLPELQAADDPDPLGSLGSITFRICESRHSAPLVVDRRGAAAFRDGHALVQVHSLGFDRSVAATARWPDVRCRNGEPLVAKLTLDSPPPDTAWPSSESGVADLFCFRVSTLRIATKPSAPLRMGSLEVELAGLSSAVAPVLVARFRAWLGRPDPDRAVLGNREAMVKLPLMAVRPGSQDPPAQTIRAKTDATAQGGLVVPLSSPVSGPGQLEVEDVFGDGAAQETTVRLLLEQQQLPTFQVLVLDPSPFSIAAVAYRAAQNAVEAESAEVANWSQGTGRTGNWEIAVRDSAFELILPPQGVGEAMHKRRDLADVGPEQPVAYRFTIPTRLAVSRGLPEQRYTSPPWNLSRSLVRGRGTMPPLSLCGITTELLYGLVATAEPVDTKVEELGSRLGHRADALRDEIAWPSTPTQGQVWRRKVADWRRVDSAVDHRLALLQPWRDDGAAWHGSGDDKVRFFLRKTAALSPPVPIDRVNGELPRGFDEKGLKGGCTWPLESVGYLLSLLQLRDQGTGDLVLDGFSSLGATGSQRAVFGLLTIDAQVVMGRVVRVTVERLGRIGVLWDRAKHVIVYERRVAPTAQFAGQQYSLLGSPILRKSEEYIELITDEHRFAHETGALPVDHGCVIGCHFGDGKPVRILVDSLWGSDVHLAGRRGWIVPLWLPVADPSVYPRPKIDLLLAGPGGDEIRQALRDPDQLVFFTETSDGRDPAEWPPYPGIDTALAVPPSSPAPRASSDPAAIAPTDADPAVAPGFSRFTFQLERGEGAADVVAGRSERAVTVELTHVAISRGTIDRAPDELDAALSTLASSRVTAETLLQQSVGEAVEQVRQEIGVAKEKIDQFAKRLPMPTAAQLEPRCVGALLAKVSDASRAPVVEWLRGVATELVAIKVDGRRRLLQLHDAVLSRQQQGDLKPTQLPRLLAVLRDVMATTEGKIFAEIDGMLFAIDEVLDDVDGDIGGLGRVAAAAAARIRDALACNRTPMLAMAAYFGSDIESLWWAADPSQRDSWLTLRLAKLQAGLEALPGVADLPSVVALRARLEEAGTSIAKWFDDTHAFLDRLEGSDLAPMLAVADELAEIIDALFRPLLSLQDPIAAIPEAVGQWLGDLDGNLSRAWQSFTTVLHGHAKRLAERWAAGLGGVATTLAELAEVEDWERVMQRLPRGLAPRALEAWLRECRGLVGTIRHAVPVDLSALPNPSSHGLQVLRAFGRAPSVPGLDFAKTLGGIAPHIAFYFRDGARALVDHVRTTPLAGFANRVAASVLNPVQIVAPMVGIGDVLRFPSLSGFDVGKMFRDLAGLPLQRLLPDMRLPEFANDSVQITHGFDAQSRGGWLQAEANVPFGSTPLTLVSLPVVAIRLRNARLKATARIEAAVGQPPRQILRGSIGADWDLVIAGLHLCTFERTELQFDECGRLAFDIRPDRVRLNGALSFLGDLLRRVTGAGGSRFEVDGGTVRSRLDVGIPDVRLGTFGLTNLRLGVGFELSVASGLELATGFNIGRRDAPFTLTVFVLGGAGFIETDVRYRLSSGDGTPKLAVSVSIGIFAAAALEIDLGIVRGGVSVRLGVMVDYRSPGTTGPRGLVIGIALVIAGEVSLLGLVQVQLVVGLELSYFVGPPARFRGRGYVRLRIKVFWFLTINVSAAVELELGGGSAAQSESETKTLAPSSATLAELEGDPYLEAAVAYQDMFGWGGG